MPAPKDYSRLLANQESGAAQERRTRLIAADDPVFIHLATLSTCAAVGGIEWTLENRKGDRVLEAIDHSGKRERAASKECRSKIGGRILTENGVELVAESHFSEASPYAQRAFPSTIDASLQRKGGQPDLIYSDLHILREPSQSTERALKVGISVVHNAFPTGIALVNQTPRPHEFDSLFGLLKENGGSGVPLLLESYKPKASDGRLIDSITSMPGVHFSFQEALGVPDDTLARAKQNFAVLAEHLDLPYDMPHFD